MCARPEGAVGGAALGLPSEVLEVLNSERPVSLTAWPRQARCWADERREFEGICRRLGAGDVDPVGVAPGNLSNGVGAGVEWEHEEWLWGVSCDSGGLGVSASHGVM